MSLQTQADVAASNFEDHNDYYFLASGKKLKLYRKKNTFVLRGVQGTKASDAVRRMQSNFGGRVARVSANEFGNVAVVNVNNDQRAKRRSKQAFNIEASMLKRLDASITNVDPVFSSGAAQGDIMLLPRLTFELNDVDQLQPILKKYGLTLNRKLRLSANVYSTSLNNSTLSAEQIFPLVRNLSSETSVNWAEPQFHFKPVKNAYTPSDSLFAQQWHLRDQGYRGSRCDTDCDADNAWAGPTGATTGANTVCLLYTSPSPRDS